MNTYQLLNQTEVWIDKHGNTHPLEEMDPNYRDNVMFFLVRHCRRYLFHYTIQELAHTPVYPEKYLHEFMREWEDRWERRYLDPRGWMRNTELYHALWFLNRPMEYFKWLRENPDKDRIKTLRQQWWDEPERYPAYD